MRRVGPFRVVLDDMARGVAYDGRIELHAALDGVEIPSEFGLSDVRASLDFRPEAMPATYRHANVPEGVAIDGRADTVPAGSTSRWREIVLSSGRLVFLTTAEVPRGARLYYKDDSGRDPRDTGDRMSYGDSGVVIPDPDAAFATGLHLSFVVLGPDEDISPKQLVAQHDHPPVVSVAGGELAPTPSATVHAVTATSTPSVTSTPGDEATPSAVASGTATATQPPDVTATPSGTGGGHCYLAYVAR